MNDEWLEVFNPFVFVLVLFLMQMDHGLLETSTKNFFCIIIKNA